ncbi:serine/threonine-protein kinase [Nocardia farcinica]|uniref:serine/threonine-protein kinase n=1 Tax=Nocardia farcinica TaxID=37329 RepID=UPI00245563C6|nr:serine/threonine-protein kinase [Nocardia farcinica]
MAMPPGTVFAGFRIERTLGSGGMGTVYLARHPRLPRSVALKVLDAAAGADPEFRARFAREADIAVRLDHPHVVEIYDRGAEDERLWISMRYVAGPDAARLIREHGRLPARRAVGLVAQAAAGLDAAHRRGLLHRDVKPANLLVAADDDGGDHVFVADFGIARSRDDAVRLTGAGALPATLGYVAPEQIDGREPDHRSDLYSLGVTLYQMLTGALPFTGTTPAELLRAHLLEPPPPVTRRAPDLPRALDDVLATALAKDPAERYPDCRALAAAAAAALADHPPGPEAAGPEQNSGRADRPHQPSPHRAGPAPHAPAAARATVRPLPDGSSAAAPDNHRTAHPPGRPAAVWWGAGVAVAGVLAVALVLAFGRTATTVPGSAVAGPTTSPPPVTSGTATTTAATNPAWGRTGELAALLPGLIPDTPDATGYQGARCTPLDVLDNGRAPALECVQDNGIHFYAWSFRPGDPRRDETFRTAVTDDTTREEVWQRDSGTGRVRWTHYAGGDTGLLTVTFDDPARAWIVLDVSWDHHTGQDLYDHWWATAPL